MNASLKRMVTWLSSGLLTVALSSCSVGFLGDDGTASPGTTVGGTNQTGTTGTSGTPTHIQITGPSTVAPNSCATYFVGVADVYNNFVPATTSTTVAMTTSGGAFYSDANCTAASSSVTIPTGQVGVPIYFKDPTVQSVTLTGSATGLTAGTLPVNVTGTGGTGGTGVPSRLSLIGSSQAALNACTPYYVTVLDASGLPAPVTTAMAITLGGQSSGAFYTDANCTAFGNPTVPAGQNLATFYFKDGVAQVVTLSASSGALTPATLAVSVGGAGGGGTGSATGITLTVGGSGVYVNTCTMLTIQTVNSSGVATAVASNTTIQLTGSGVSFFSDSGCSISLAPANQVTVYAGQNQTIVWFRGTAAGTATITAQSVPVGILATVYINFYINGSGTGGGGGGSLTVPVIYDVLLSSNGQHVVGGVGGPSNYTCSAAVEDCGGGTCAGQQTMCAAGSTNLSSAVLDVWITANGTHTQSIYCPNGYSLVGVINDCYGGVCSGYQSFCKATTNYPHALMALQGLSVSALNAHTNQVSCPSGWDLVGTIEDCGNRVCQGVQTMCSRKAYVP